MLSLPSSARVFVCTQPTDMRKSFDGLSGLVAEVFQGDLLSGHLFVFFNRRRDRVKILAWDRDGLSLWYHRLERGSYEVVDGAVGGQEIDSRKLSLLLSGIELSSVRQRKRFSKSEV
jgi:hypothetical protein